MKLHIVIFLLVANLLIGCKEESKADETVEFMDTIKPAIFIGKKIDRH